MIPKGTHGEKNRIQTDRILKDSRCHVLDVPVICNTDHCLVVTDGRERLSVGKLAMDMDILIWRNSIWRS